MNSEGRTGKRQHITKRKTAEVRRFSDERLKQFEKEKASRRDGDEKRRNFETRRDDRLERKSRFDSRESDFEDRNSRRGGFEKRSFRKDRDDNHDFERRNFKRDRDDSRDFGRKSFRKDRDDRRDYRETFRNRGEEQHSHRRGAARFDRFDDDDRRGFKREEKDFRERRGSGFRRREKDPLHDRPKATGLIRLNKYLADSGICSRREADDLILAGAVTVNGEVVKELGVRVGPEDKVSYGGETLRREKLRYVLLNKPKGVITTSDDPYERHTVMELVEGACEERIYPVGRLDRNTIGLLLLTNDGDLAKTLTHPSHEVKKLYHATLNKTLTKNDLAKIQEGLVLEDGPIKVDDISWVVDDPTKREIGIEIHSGRNHIVRRIFESLGYEVVKLDRVMFAGLTKQNLPRGHWRFLTSAEISMLKRIQ